MTRRELLCGFFVGGATHEKKHSTIASTNNCEGLCAVAANTDHFPSTSVSVSVCLCVLVLLLRTQPRTAKACGGITEVQPAKDIIDELVAGAVNAMQSNAVS